MSEGIFRVFQEVSNLLNYVHQQLPLNKWKINEVELG